MDRKPVDDKETRGDSLTAQDAGSESSWSSHSDSSSTAHDSSPRNESTLSEKPPPERRGSLGRRLTEDDIARTLTQRRTGSVQGETDEDTAQIVRLVSRMFGHDRKANSDEEKTRHQGVVWKNLTVKGVGLGAAMQPTNSDILFAIPRLIKQLCTHGNRNPLRTILDDFTVCSLQRNPRLSDNRC